MSKEMIIELNKKLDAVRAEGLTVTAEMEKKYKEDPANYTAADYNTKMEAINKDGFAIRAQIEMLKGFGQLQDFSTAPEGQRTNTATAGEKGVDKKGRIVFKSWGERFTESMEFKEAAKLKRIHTEPMNVKAQYEGSGSDPAGLTGNYGGHLVVVDRLTTVYDKAPLRPRRLLEVVGKSTTNSDRVEYAFVESKNSGADIVPERNSGNTDFATKPQSDLQFDMAEEMVRTIAHWIPASRQILQDAPQLRQLIDNFLGEGLELKVENLILNGTGTGNQWRGILAAAGLSRVHKTSGRGFNALDNDVDTIRRAITDINLAFYRADGILLNPIQSETLELLKDDNKQYLNVFNPLAQTVWRLPVIESQVITAGTAVVGNWRQGCTLWDRMQTEIRVGEPMDYFIKNAVAILAELRAAFGVIFEDTFEVVTGLD